VAPRGQPRGQPARGMTRNRPRNRSVRSGCKSHISGQRRTNAEPLSQDGKEGVARFESGRGLRNRATARFSYSRSGSDDHFRTLPGETWSSMAVDRRCVAVARPRSTCCSRLKVPTRYTPGANVCRDRPANGRESVRRRSGRPRFASRRSGPEVAVVAVRWTKAALPRLTERCVGRSGEIAARACVMTTPAPPSRRRVHGALGSGSMCRELVGFALGLWLAGARLLDAAESRVRVGVAEGVQGLVRFDLDLESVAGLGVDH
jgi:hypothetical protein